MSATREMASPLTSKAPRTACSASMDCGGSLSSELSDSVNSDCIPSSSYRPNYSNYAAGTQKVQSPGKKGRLICDGDDYAYSAAETGRRPVEAKPCRTSFLLAESNRVV